MEARPEGGAHQTSGDAAPGDFVGNDQVFQVHKGGDDEQACEEAEREGFARKGGAFFPGNGREEEAGEGFHQQIAHRDGLFTAGAFAAQERPGN